MTDLSLFDREIDRSGTFSTKYDARQAIFGHAGVMPLWVADMDFAAPAEVTEALRIRATHPIYGYTQAPDSVYTALINWLKQRHGWEVSREWIVLCPGVMPSVTTAILTLTEADARVIVQPPVYFPFFSAIGKTGRQLLKNPLRQQQDQRYGMDLETLSAQAATARMMLFCSPHNPVGRVWRKSELLDMLEICQRHQLIVVCDEIHADLIYPEYQHQVLAALTDNPQQIITAVAPSKTFNIPGLNLSALIVPNPQYRKAIIDYLDKLHISVTNPFSLVAFEAAYQHGELWLDFLMTYLAHSRDLVQRFLTEYLPEIKLIPPQGTYLLWLDCRALGMNDDALNRFFIFEAGIGLSPGVLFGAEGTGFMRMNLAAPRHKIQQALDNIIGAVHRYRQGQI
ncbi:MAG: PatB family C-S lyase [Nitrosomonas sp.]|nr:PatB family C-S lyase [Nitrosomonas sp.]